MKKNVCLYVVALIASLSGLLAGYDTGVISGALLYINNSFEMSPEVLGFLVSSVSIGAVFGALINGVLIDKIGRKKILILSSLVFIIGSLSCSISTSIWQLVFSRMFLGAAVGIVSFAGPLYLSEISTKNKRGSIVSMYQIALTFGILFSYLTNYFCANLETSWRAMLFVGAIPAFVLLIGMLFQLDTLRWYVLKNN